MKKYLKTVILIILTVIIFSSYSTALEKYQINNKISDDTKLYSLQNIKLKQINNHPLERGYVMFSQMPYLPDECWSFYPSAENTGCICQDDFWDLRDPINDVHWWGLTLIFDGGWIQGSPEDMEFEIIFYKDNAGAPGDIEKTFSNITPTYTDTQLIYGDLYKLYYFQTNLLSEVALVNGWISIQSTYSPDNSSLLIAGSPDGNFNALQNGANLLDNLAFNLTTNTPPPSPKICCNGSLIWEKIKIGSTVNATFQISNCGETGSLLNWDIDTIPEWGNWTITPSSGKNLATGNNINITVEVVAPAEKKKTFTGKIKIINTDNPTDFCEIDVILKTPKIRTIKEINLLQWILKKLSIFV